MRLFIAIEIPQEQKKGLTELETRIPGCRWVKAEQIHLTLAFLGEVDEETLGILKGELATIRGAPFTLSLMGTGCFPNRHHPRVIWTGIKPDTRLTLLASAVGKAVIACGIPLEERPFSPHITLARLKLPCPGETAAFLDLHKDFAMAPFSVEGFTIFRSLLTRGGAEHVPIMKFPLAE